MDNIIQSEIALRKVVFSGQLLQQLLGTPNLEPGPVPCGFVALLDELRSLALIHTDHLEIHQFLNFELLARRGDSPVDLQLAARVPCLLLCEFSELALVQRCNSMSELLQPLGLLFELDRVLSQKLRGLFFSDNESGLLRVRAARQGHFGKNKLVRADLIITFVLSSTAAQFLPNPHSFLSL